MATIGAQANRRSYDAFGAVREADYSPRPNGTLNLGATIHGFTGHTHADDVALIHMGGRAYAPNLGRFLSVDPIIQDAANSQSLNPYSYVLNNPFAGRDPTGYARECMNGVCTLTEVQQMEIRQKNGKYFAVATDKHGNMVKVDSISSASNGSMKMDLSQAVLTAAFNKDPSTIGSLQALNLSSAHYFGADYNKQLSNELAADYFGGFGKSVAEGAALAALCGTSSVGAAACVAYGAGEMQAGNPSGMGWFLAGAGGGWGRSAKMTAPHASEEAKASAVFHDVETPWGLATQSSDAAALAARQRVENGGLLYRVGTLGKSEATLGQFWALEHPCGWIRRALWNSAKQYCEC